MSKKTMADLWKELTKQHGDEGLFHGNDAMTTFTDVISSGSHVLDDALGIWGLPRGRVIQYAGQESSGKTYMSLVAIAEYQRSNPDGWALFIDAELTFDQDWAECLGVDLERLIVYRENSGIKIFERLIGQPNKTGGRKVKLGILDLEKENPTGLGIIVLDSIAAVTPPAEEISEVGKQNMTLMARFLPPELRKLTPLLSDTGVTMIFINQIRVKPGVMYGCLSGNTLLNFADGRSIPMSKVVKNKIKGDVYCLNEETGKIETRPIVDWHNNGRVECQEDFIHILAEGICTVNGVVGFHCTPNHEVLTNSGWKEAKEINYSDSLVSKYTENINGTFGDFMRGVFIGDSCIGGNRERSRTLALQDNTNPKYVEWKIDKISPFMKFRVGEHKKYRKYVSSSYSYELLKIKKELSNRDPMYMLKNYSDLGMAIWVMDDGHFDTSDGRTRYTLSVKRFKRDRDKLEQIVDRLDELEFGCRYSFSNGNIVFDKISSEILAERICKYIPECMQYKLPEKFKGKYEEFTLFNNPIIRTDNINIKLIERGSKKTMRNRGKFDISVKDNHNYMVGSKHNGIIIHNSPETTPGGNTLKHTHSMMLNFSRIAAKNSIIEVDGERVGHHVRVRIDKNKLAPPFKVAELAITYNSGVIEHEVEIRDLGAKYGIIDRPNNKTWVLDDVKYNGKDAMAEALRDTDLRNNVLERVKEAKKNMRRKSLTTVEIIDKEVEI